MLKALWRSPSVASRTSLAEVASEQWRHIKHWLQIFGVCLMVDSILPNKDVLLPWMFDRKTFLAGVLVFLSTLLTWKAKKYEDDGSKRQ